MMTSKKQRWWEETGKERSRKLKMEERKNSRGMRRKGKKRDRNGD